MNQTQNTKQVPFTSAVVATVLAAVVFLGGGYTLGARTHTNEGMHTMPDGSVMNNNGSTMSMAEMMSGMNTELAGKTGDAFDKAFLSEMIVHHQGAVEMAQSALTSANHKEIKDLAAGIIAAQNKEIGEMQSWQKAWYAN